MVSDTDLLLPKQPSESGRLGWQSGGLRRPFRPGANQYHEHLEIGHEEAPLGFQMLRRKQFPQAAADLGKEPRAIPFTSGPGQPDREVPLLPFEIEVQPLIEDLAMHPPQGGVDHAGAQLLR